PEGRDGSPMPQAARPSATPTITACDVQRIDLPPTRPPTSARPSALSIYSGAVQQNRQTMVGGLILRDGLVRKAPDRQGKEIRRVPAADHAEILVGDEGRPARALGQHDRSRQVACRQGAAVGPADAEPLPLAQALAGAVAGEAGVEPG